MLKIEFATLQTVLFAHLCDCLQVFVEGGAQVPVWRPLPGPPRSASCPSHVRGLLGIIEAAEGDSLLFEGGI